MPTNQFGKWGGTVPTRANLSAMDISEMEDGVMAPVQENDCIYLLQATSTETVDGDLYLSTSTGTGRWHKIGGGGGGGGGGGTLRAAAPPDPTNAGGYSIHIEDKIDPVRHIVRAWDGAAWVDTKYSVAYQATSIAPIWPPDGDGQICVDTMNKNAYIAIGGIWNLLNSLNIPYQP